MPNDFLFTSSVFSARLFVALLPPCRVQCHGKNDELVIVYSLGMRQSHDFVIKYCEHEVIAHALLMMPRKIEHTDRTVIVRIVRGP